MGAAAANPGWRIARVAAAGTLLLLCAAPGTAGATPGAAPGAHRAPTAPAGIRLATPVHGVDPLTNVTNILNGKFKLRPDRLRKSSVPGTVHDDERVHVALGPTGAPAVVTDLQRLVITGAGNYIVRELGPARQAVGLGATVPPVLELGTVVWMGFSPGRRALSARLTLDPGIEAARLPLTVRFGFRDDHGRPGRLGPGAMAPAAGVVTVTLHNNSATTMAVQTGIAAARPLTAALTRLLTAGSRPQAAVPPVAGGGLPRVIRGRVTGTVQLPVTAPLRVTGRLTAPGGAAAVSGPGTSPAAGGVDVAGTLSADAQFTVRVRRGDRIGLHLDVRPWLDPRTVTPPAPARTWAQWLHRHPTSAAVANATQTLVAAAAATARSADYSPYLQADVPGPDLSTFTYDVAPPATVRIAAKQLRPRPGAITAAAVALLAIVGNAVLLRRRA